MRGGLDDFSIDRTGFCVASLKTALAYDDFTSGERIESVYYREVESLLQRDFGAERVVRAAPSDRAD